jgi:hypothetical protein
VPTGTVTKGLVDNGNGILPAPSVAAFYSNLMNNKGGGTETVSSRHGKSGMGNGLSHFNLTAITLQAQNAFKNQSSELPGNGTVLEMLQYFYGEELQDVNSTYQNWTAFQVRK